MPRRNRVTPFGALEVSSAKGRYMGNRGDLHDAQGRISPRLYRTRAWICCSLDERNGRRVVFDTRGRYTPLFFYDEAVALAAGHRPCAECRRADYKRFVACGGPAFRDADGMQLRAADMDRILHAERIEPAGPRNIWQAPVAELPQGTFIVLGGLPHLMWDGSLFSWTHDGYCKAEAGRPETMADVLTPPSIVTAIAGGYVPVVHI